MNLTVNHIPKNWIPERHEKYLEWSQKIRSEDYLSPFKYFKRQNNEF